MSAFHQARERRSLRARDDSEGPPPAPALLARPGCTCRLTRRGQAALVGLGADAIDPEARTTHALPRIADALLAAPARLRGQGLAALAGAASRFAGAVEGERACLRALSPVYTRARYPDRCGGRAPCEHFAGRRAEVEGHVDVARRVAAAAAALVAALGPPPLL
eukprot:tig00020510_g9929.t1